MFRQVINPIILRFRHIRIEKGKILKKRKVEKIMRRKQYPKIQKKLECVEILANGNSLDES
jgi:hypothetical protein